MIEELEDEVTEMRAIALRTSAYKLKKLEEDNIKISDELTDIKTRYDDITRANSKIDNINLCFQYKINMSILFKNY